MTVVRHMTCHMTCHMIGLGVVSQTATGVSSFHSKGDRPVPILPERRNSFKKTLVNAFKKKSHTATFAEPETDTPHPPAKYSVI